MSIKQKILLVDDDSDIRELISYNLLKEGYLVETAKDGEEAINLINSSYDIIILDIMMPKLNGYEVCKKIRDSNYSYNKIPILFLSAKDTEFDEVLGLEMGGDGFLIKPISIKKLLAHVKSNIRKSIYRNDDSKDLIFGELIINKEKRSVKINSHKLPFTKTEFNILFILLKNEDKVYKRDELINLLQDDFQVITDRTIDVHIKKIRTKLRTHSKLIETVHGVGYVARKDNISEVN